MITLPNVFETEPEFVNELGTKWWKDEHTTKYAQQPDSFGTTLDAVAFCVETSSGSRTRLLIERSSEKLLAEDQTLDGIGTKIEVIKLLKREKEL